MSRLFMLTHAITFGTIPARSMAQPVRRARPSRGAIIFFTLGIMGAVVYLFVVNSLATAGFVAQSRSRTIERLLAEQTALRADYEERRSWDAIVKRLPELELVETTRVSYVQADPDPLALASYAQPSP